ncbi:MAG: protein translocase subunit SecF [Myxococcales bacterium]|nr:protein translocase subunit SecF [Myxococcales bacterium]MDD9965825.1 protein translocase subunit SecF [Myxococcales bacterium]
MEFFKPGRTIDFLKHRRIFGSISFGLVVASLISLFVPGPNFGIDFKGGTELEVGFKGEVSTAELRSLVSDLGYQQSEVVSVQGSKVRYLIRIQEVSSLSAQQVKKIRASLESALGETELQEMKVSPGGDKISLRLSASADTDNLQEALEKAGAKVRKVTVFGGDFRYEAMLVGVGDEVVRGLVDKLGERGPDRQNMRIEWVGPKAGAQLRDAAIKSLLYAIAFIMAYVALRFDLRFAPGGVVAMVHDALITVGLFVLLRKEVNLATVAALLTVVGYSINDTIVVYDRIRENMQRMRDTGLYQLINVSTSQTLSRTVVTSITTLISIGGFFLWGTPMMRDIVFALFVGFLIGTYSSIYIAAPFTEWMDRRFFRRA